MNKTETNCIIVEDYNETTEELDVEKVTKVKRVRKIQEPLQKYLKPEKNIFEIGVDEAGRGPLFGRVYTAAVILPKDDSFDHSKVKDSKKFSSKKKIEDVAEYIKKNALAWHVSFEDETSIENINILQATQKSMHTSILGVKNKYIQKQNDTCENVDIQDNSFHLLIDGNYFNPITYVNKSTNKLETMAFDMIEGGDNKYTPIAAASILAKVERDKYIEELCELHPYLSEKYGIDTNKGYGAKKHIEGIKEHGITIWHRKTFGICKKYV